MNIIVQGPDGATFEFPDGTDQATMTKAMQSHYGAPKPTPLQTARDPLSKVKDWNKGLTKEFQAEKAPQYPGAVKKAESDLTRPVGDFKTFWRGANTVADLANRAGDLAMVPLAAVGDAANTLTLGAPAAVNSTLVKTVGPAVSYATGGWINEQTGGALASMLLPFVGEELAPANAARIAKASGVSREAVEITHETARRLAAEAKKPNVLKTVTAKPGELYSDQKRAEAVSTLKRAGAKLTRGQEAGGADKTVEEVMADHPIIGETTKREQRRSFESMNVAAYDDALSEIGQKYTGKAVGYDGIAKLSDIADHQYEAIRAGLVAKQDEQFAADIAKIRQGVPSAYQPDFDRIVADHVLNPFKDGGGMVQGDSAKAIQSDINHFAAEYKRSGTASERFLGQALDDVHEALGSSFERHSDPKVSADLAATNRFYAKYKVLENAAANRVKSGGVFSGSDMLSAIKRNPYGSKGSFAKGRGLMQDFASAADRVMGNEVPNSGTPTRLAQLARMGAGAGPGMLLHNLPMAAAGAAIDPALNAAAGAYTRGAGPSVANFGKALLARRGSTSPKNYLAHATRAVDPLVAHRPNPALAAPAVAGAAASQGPTQ